MRQSLTPTFFLVCQTRKKLLVSHFLTTLIVFALPWDLRGADVAILGSNPVPLRRPPDVIEPDVIGVGDRD